MTAPTKTPPAIRPAWVPDLDTFGARLALVRQKMGWGNVAEAARECGLDRESWRLWEQTGREPRRFVTIAMVISARTGCDLDWLVYGPRPATPLAPAPQTTPYSSSRFTGPIDPLQPRIVAKVGDVRHGDGRQTRPSTPSQRGRNPQTRGHGLRPVSRIHVA